MAERKGLNLSTEIKDIYIISADPWGQYEIESDNIRYGVIGNLHGLQCRNADNYKEILDKCSQVVKVIEEIEQLNK
jgi:hypothetical protein